MVLFSPLINQFIDRKKNEHGRLPGADDHAHLFSAHP
jgi:hypothetical protein